jgi:anti-sigma regulatory factor (Ser/Thr protein kinase)
MQRKQMIRRIGIPLSLQLMLQALSDYLAVNPGAKAKTIAIDLGFDRAKVNRLLHDHPEKFEQDSEFQWSLASSEVCHIEFGGDEWLTSYHFEKALKGVSPLESDHSSVVLALKSNCRPMLDFNARLLALCNQLVNAGKTVTLDLEGSKKTSTYLDRIGFFGRLHDDIEVLPRCDRGNLAKTYDGNNDGVMEFRPIDPANRDDDVPERLLNSFVKCSGPAYKQAAFTLLSELYGNVLEHSRTSTPGFACLQFYRGSKSIQAVISDNGLGIVGTLLPVVRERHPKTFKKVAAAAHPGVALLKEVFSSGDLSQVNDDGRGLGLKASADAAGKFRADVSVRQSDFELRIHRDHSGVRFSQQLGLAHLHGTHICFRFKLDASHKSP